MTDFIIMQRAMSICEVLVFFRPGLYTVNVIAESEVGML
jgi:hypothetical protein